MCEAATELDTGGKYAGGMQGCTPTSTVGLGDPLLWSTRKEYLLRTDYSTEYRATRT